jgi:hypothetical protein
MPLIRDPVPMIGQGGHRLSQGRRLHGPLAVVHMPSVEELDDLTAVRIVAFDGVNPLDRIATTKRQKWVTASPRRRCSIVESNTRCAIE